MVDDNEEEDVRKLLNALYDAVTDLRRQNRKPGEKFIVYVDDNFHFSDEDERYTLGEFDTEEEAVAAAKSLIDQFLEKSDHKDSTPESLFKSYTQYGEDPFIPGVSFHAWDYARQRCQELCAGK